MNKNGNNSSFNEMNFLEKIIVVTALTLLVILSVAFIIGSIFFGITGFLNLFGVKYESFSSLLLFVLFFFLIGFILDFISIAFIRFATQNLRGKYKSFFTRMMIDCTFSWLSFHTADEMISGITIPFTTEILAVLLFFLIEIAFEDTEKRKLKRGR
ncbi:MULTISPECIES: YrvL family regulatory protein [Parageobacillus]|nr:MULTISPECIES: YrvL family regulatory protein [Parageobacillus]BDG48997.1 hypothetical protein PspKH34_35580 [Parageobacillus sp. KH3-4]